MSEAARGASEASVGGVLARASDAEARRISRDPRWELRRLGLVRDACTARVIFVTGAEDVGIGVRLLYLRGRGGGTGGGLEYRR